MKKHAFTLVELLVVIAVVGLLAVISVVAIKASQGSFETGISHTAINALLSAARAMAEQHQQYTGVRFQRIDGKQYAVFVRNERNLIPEDDPNFVCFSVRGQKALVLTKRFGIAFPGVIEKQIIEPQDEVVTILFSPNGHLVRKWLVVQRHPGLTDDIFGDILPEDSIPIMSDNGLVIFDAGQYKRSDVSPELWQQLKVSMVNRYTGQLITGL
jgi:prepilin-type N-terminal cleavage/methylation domain-containing protein